jgi:predicted nucleotidyltransferase
MSGEGTRTLFEELATLSGAEREALRRYRRALQERLGDNLIKTVLFGSRARGEGGTGSDLDVLVLYREEKPHLRREITDLAVEIFLDVEIDLSPLPMSEEHFQKLKGLERALALSIEKEGVEF